MHLLGRANWYIPSWLDQLLPALTIEAAEAPEAPRPEPEWVLSPV